MIITDEMLKLATDAIVMDLYHGSSHGCRIRWGTSPDNFNLDGHVDLRSIARAALSVVKDSLTTADTTNASHDPQGVISEPQGDSEMPGRRPREQNTTQEKT